jgi:hypothetical protein
MKKNVGSIDKVARIIIAAVLAAVVISSIITGTLGIVALLIAAVLLITSLVGFCPLYRILGISTCKTDKAVVKQP